MEVKKSNDSQSSYCNDPPSAFEQGVKNTSVTSLPEGRPSFDVEEQSVFLTLKLQPPVNDPNEPLQRAGLVSTLLIRFYPSVTSLLPRFQVTFCLSLSPPSPPPGGRMERLSAWGGGGGGGA